MKLHQKKLLKLLAMNCRFTNKDLAKSLRVSEDTIHYTKQEFIKKNFFSYSIFFDYRKLGFVSHHILLRVKNINTINFKDIISIQDVQYINTFLGKYDLQIIILAKNDAKEKIDNIISHLGDNVLSYEVYQYKKEYKLTHILPEYDVDVELPQNQKNKIYRLQTPVLSVSDYTTGYRLDKKDILMIKSLLANPAKKYFHIQKETGLSRDTIVKRMKCYIDDGFLLSFSIFPNIKYFGYHTYCLLFKLRDIKEPELQSFVRKKDYIFYVEGIMGEKDLFFYVWAKTPGEFSRIFKEIKQFFVDDMIDVDLLFFDDYIYQKEFPSSLFEEG